MRELIRKRTRNIGRRDDGAVLIIVAVFSLVAVLFMAFVIDIGNQRQNRRQLTTATDSPALAVAQDWVRTGANPAFDCDDTTIDEELAIANNPVGNANPVYDCDFSQVDPFRGGVVTISSQEDVDYAFDGVTGIEGSSTGSLTSVRVETIVGGGLRPVAFCSGDFDRDGWTTSASGIQVAPPSSSQSITLTNTRGNDADPCRSAGNWNQVIFRENNTCPGQSNAAGAGPVFRDQYENGSPYDVTVNECVSRYPGTGGFNSGDPEIIEGMTVAFPIFDEAVGGGAGIYRVAGFLEAFVESVNSHGNTTSFVLEPLRYITSGTCCLINESNVEMTVCDTGTISGAANSDAATNCQPRGSGSGSVTPPVVPDMCTVVAYDPPSPQFEVNPSSGLVRNESVAVEVVDHADCDALSLEAIRGSQVVSVQDPPTRSGNRYTFTYQSGTTFAAPGATYVLEVLEDGLVLDDGAILETVGESVSCSAGGTITGSPANSELQAPPDKTKLANDIVFEIPVSSSSACLGTTARLQNVRSTAVTNPLVVEVMDATTLRVKALTGDSDYSKTHPNQAGGDTWRLEFQLPGESAWTSTTVIVVVDDPA